MTDSQVTDIQTYLARWGNVTPGQALALLSEHDRLVAELATKDEEIADALAAANWQLGQANLAIRRYEEMKQRLDRALAVLRVVAAFEAVPFSPWANDGLKGKYRIDGGYHDTNIVAQAKAVLKDNQDSERTASERN